MSQTPDQDANRPCFGCRHCSKSPLVPSAPVRRTRVDHDGIHGAVEKHDFSLGIERVKGIQRFDDNKFPTDPVVVWRRHGSSECRDAKQLLLLGKFWEHGTAFRDAAPRPRRHLHGHDVGRVGAGIHHGFEAPSDGRIGLWRSAETMANVLAQHPQVLMRLTVGQDLVENGTHQGAVPRLRLGRRGTRRGRGQNDGPNNCQTARQHCGWCFPFHASKGSGMCPNLVT